IHTFANTNVIGLTINHENMSCAEVDAAITLYEYELGIPATDALTKSPARLVEMVFTAFPDLKKELAVIA
ncbi:MAG: NAD-dependent epimerase/dehydratase family protein, partial [Nitrospinota bacterium]|nr:NAD-dependent epimerase/dehydratase family protein [Nitrospinota bacterium]